MKATHLPGVATWASLNGEVIWQKCYGYANLEDSVPVADTTLFMLASISKTITATAAMQLWEREEFELDDDINDYLPFEVRNPNHPDSVITFRMLMTHTSSIEDNWTVIDPLYVWGGDSPIPLGSFLEDYLVPGGAYYDSASNFHTYPPGDDFDYCNVAVALLGYLVEAIEDSFPIHCQDSIFDPLSMYETSWFLAGLNMNNIAVPYHWSGVEYVPYQHYGYPDYPDGQLRTSAQQLARHLMAFIQYGMVDTVRILDSTTVDIMRTVQYDVTSTWKMGLIWMYQYVSARWLWGHAGADWGVSTVAVFCPSENSVVIVLTNGESQPGKLAIMNTLLNYAQELSVQEMDDQYMPASFLQVYPNPFKNLTTVSFSKGQRAESMELQIYDAAGRLVRQWDDAAVRTSEYITWNGTDNTGKELGSGVYFVTLQAGECGVTQKVLLVR